MGLQYLISAISFPYLQLEKCSVKNFKREQYSVKTIAHEGEVVWDHGLELSRDSVSADSLWFKDSGQIFWQSSHLRESTGDACGCPRWFTSVHPGFKSGRESSWLLVHVGLEWSPCIVFYFRTAAQLCKWWCFLWVGFLYSLVFMLLLVLIYTECVVRVITQNGQCTVRPPASLPLSLVCSLGTIQDA